MLDSSIHTDCCFLQSSQSRIAVLYLPLVHILIESIHEVESSVAPVDGIDGGNGIPFSTPYSAEFKNSQNQRPPFACDWPTFKSAASAVSTPASSKKKPKEPAPPPPLLQKHSFATASEATGTVNSNSKDTTEHPSLSLDGTGGTSSISTRKAGGASVIALLAEKLDRVFLFSVW